MNVILNIPGNDLVLCHIDDVSKVRNKYERKISDYRYFYTRSILGWKFHFLNYYYRMKAKLGK